MDIPLVARLVHDEFFLPEPAVLARNPAFLAGVGVPVATVNEDDGAKGGEDEIRPAGQALGMEPVTEPRRPYGLAH